MQEKSFEIYDKFNNQNYNQIYIKKDKDNKKIYKTGKELSFVKYEYVFGRNRYIFLKKFDKYYKYLNYKKL